MKKKINLILVLIFVSCSETSSEVFFTLYNETDKNVKILAYNSIDKNLLEEINIKPLSNFRKKQFTDFENTLDMAFYSNSGVDSLRMIFNLTKVVVYTLNEDNTNNRDVFYGNNYEYRISQQDCSIAVDCFNDCE